MALNNCPRAKRDPRSDGAWVYLTQLAGVRMWLDLEESRLEALTPLLEASRARVPLRIFTAGLALVRALTGDLEGALAGLADIVDGLAELPYDWSRLPTLALASEVCFRARAPIAAAALQRELQPYAALGAVTHNAGLYLGSVQQALGWLAAARGRSADAIRHFESAYGVHAALRSPPWCARSERAIAEVRTNRARAV